MSDYFLLKEDGDYLLKEDGDKLILYEAISVLVDTLVLASSVLLLSVSGDSTLVMNALELASLAVSLNPLATPRTWSRNFIRPRARGFINIPISKTTEQ